MKRIVNGKLWDSSEADPIWENEQGEAVHLFPKSENGHVFIITDADGEEKMVTEGELVAYLEHNGIDPEPFLDYLPGLKNH